MIALVSVLAVVLLSLIVTRVAAVLLVLTGMSHEAGRFQARSAFMGVGFTTSEAEAVTTHPQRRRIVAALMLLGSAGLVTAIASLIVSFGGTPRGDGLVRALALIGGLLLLYLLARSSWIDRRLEALVGDIMRAGGMSVRDYASLLDLEGDYAVAEKHVDAEDWMAERTLGDLCLDEEGISVLGVHRHRGGYLGLPRGDVLIEPSDRVVLYARESLLDELDERPRGEAGEAAHEAAAAEERAREARESLAADGEPTLDLHRHPGDEERGP